MYTSKTEHPRIPTEREYREWQRSLRGNVPVKRFKDEPGFLSRWASTIRHLITRRRQQPAANLRQVKHNV